MDKEINEKIPLVTFDQNDEELDNEEVQKDIKKDYQEYFETSVQKRTNIKEMDKVPLVTFDDDPGRTKPFLVLLNGNDENGDSFTEWNICHGRLEAYSYIKSYIEYIDLYESYIIGSTELVKNAIRVIDYLIHVLETEKIIDPGFDPMDYVVGDYIEEEENGDGEEQ